MLENNTTLEIYFVLPSTFYQFKFVAFYFFVDKYELVLCGLDTNEDNILRFSLFLEPN